MDQDIIIFLIVLGGIVLCGLSLLAICVIKNNTPGTRKYLEHQRKKQEKEIQRADNRYLETEEGKKFLSDFNDLCAELTNKIENKNKQGQLVYSESLELSKFMSRDYLFIRMLESYFNSRGFMINTIKEDKDKLFVLIGW